MSKLNSLMERFKSPKKEKMNELVQRSHAGSLSSFSGVFQVSPISQQEQDSLQTLLEKYQTDTTDIKADLRSLTAITSEVKAISNQAVILHGERIKRAQQLFKSYRDGAFSTWLLKTYGNRQTPYNFMQYFELYNTLPQKLKGIIDEMPRQAIYSLSSRSIPQEKKEAFIENYQGETKSELLEKLRKAFPLAKKDKRNPNKTKNAYDHLKYALKAMKDSLFVPTDEEKLELKQVINEIQSLLLR
jgi:hypothetical protein